MKWWDIFSPWGDVKKCRVGNNTIQIIYSMETDEYSYLVFLGGFSGTSSGKGFADMGTERNENKAPFVSFSEKRKENMCLVTHDVFVDETNSVGGSRQCK